MKGRELWGGSDLKNPREELERVRWVVKDMCERLE